MPHCQNLDAPVIPAECSLEHLLTLALAKAHELEEKAPLPPHVCEWLEVAETRPATFATAPQGLTKPVLVAQRLTARLERLTAHAQILDRSAK